MDGLCAVMDMDAGGMHQVADADGRAAGKSPEQFVPAEVLAQGHPEFLNMGPATNPLRFALR
jgi:hypothetical protein